MKGFSAFSPHGNLRGESQVKVREKALKKNLFFSVSLDSRELNSQIKDEVVEVFLLNTVMKANWKRNTEKYKDRVKNKNKDPYNI